MSLKTICDAVHTCIHTYFTQKGAFVNLKILNFSKNHTKPELKFEITLKNIHKKTYTNIVHE
jgi:hypothetical protein